MQVTPFYNNSAHLETGIYFLTSVDRASASGSAFLILHAASQTAFTLTFNSDTSTNDGELSMTIVKLRRTS